jgi:hypothetical protein
LTPSPVTLRRQLLDQANREELHGLLEKAIESSRLAFLLDPSDRMASGVLHLLYKRLDRLGDLKASRCMVRRENLYLAAKPDVFEMDCFMARQGLALSNDKIGLNCEAKAIWLSLLADPVLPDAIRRSVILSVLRAALAGNDRDLARRAFDLHVRTFPNTAEFTAYGMLHQATEAGGGFWEDHDILNSIAQFDLREDLEEVVFEQMNSRLTTEMNSSDDWAANYSSPGTISQRTSVSNLLFQDMPASTAFRKLLLERAVTYLTDKAKFLGPVAPNGGQLGFIRFTGLKITKLADELSHTHAGSVLSGVYYPYIPSNVNDEGPAGHIEFGRPDINFSGPPPPIRMIQPKTGLLLLFPSYLFHRILPGDFPEERFSIAFDLSLV